MNPAAIICLPHRILSRALHDVSADAACWVAPRRAAVSASIGTARARYFGGSDAVTGDGCILASTVGWEHATEASNPVGPRK